MTTAATSASSAGLANAAAFESPRSLVLARGFDVDCWERDGQAVGTGGIFNPQPTRLPTGQNYYRFASSGSPRAAQPGGGWWIEFEAITQLRHFAQANGYTLREAARLMLALPHAWTRVDLLVRALLGAPLRAWTGAGKPVQAPAGGADRGTRWIPTQHIVVRQLYVPGLSLPGADGRPLHEVVFDQPVQISRLD